MPTQAQFEEAEDLLDELKDAEPLTQEELCFWHGIRREDFPRVAQAGLERELEAISQMARAFRDHDDEESAALVRQIDARWPSCAAGSRTGARSPNAGACEDEEPTHRMGIERAGPDFNHKRRPVIEAGQQPTGAAEMGYAAMYEALVLPTAKRAGFLTGRKPYLGASLSQHGKALVYKAAGRFTAPISSSDKA